MVYHIAIMSSFWTHPGSWFDPQLPSAHVLKWNQCIEDCQLDEMETGDGETEGQADMHL